MKCTLQLGALIAILAFSTGCGPKTCDTSLQKMAASDVCDDAVNAAILSQKTASQRVLNDLDARLTCTKLKGDMLKAGDSSAHIKHKLAELGYDLGCSERAK
jgi:hypothetical protein